MTAAVLAGGAHAQSGSDGFPRNAFPDTPVPRLAERVPVFFPPYPPPLGRPPAPAAASRSRFPAPPELAEHVGEFFYPALGTRLATRTLNDKLRAQLDAYRAAKLALQNELSAELDRLQGIEPEARAGAMAALAQRQASKITDLENTGEQLRRDLGSRDNDWSALRQWHLGDKARRGFSPLEISQVMRGYAFFQNYLLPAQRRLLREISIELLFAADSTAAATAAQPFVFFPPEPARVMFPDDMPAAVAAKLASYQTRKSALKKELYEAVYAADGASFSFMRPSPMKALAEKQGERLAELEALAEEIRMGLSQAPQSGSERSPLPPAVDGRVAGVVRAFVVAQKEATAKITSILAEAKDVPMQATYRFDGDSLKFLVVPMPGRGGRGPTPGPPGRVEGVRAQFSAVAEAYGQRMADLINERESIRREIAQSSGLTKPAEIERALLSAMRIASEKENATLFADYRTAVFQPGLSPGQRRLLFDRVVERLELALPRGELQPTLRAETW